MVMRRDSPSSDFLTCRLEGGVRKMGTFSSGMGTTGAAGGTGRGTVVEGGGAGGTTGWGTGEEEAEEMSLPWYWVVWAFSEATVL